MPNSKICSICGQQNYAKRARPISSEIEDLSILNDFNHNLDEVQFTETHQIQQEQIKEFNYSVV